MAEISNRTRRGASLGVGSRPGAARMSTFLKIIGALVLIGVLIYVAIEVRS